MKTNRMQACGALLALIIWVPACVDEDDAPEQDDEDEVEIDERGYLCLYNATPPATDDSASIVGAVDEVESEDEANGGCDFHMFKVTAAPPANRARTVAFGASSYDGFFDTGARMWTRNCTFLPCSAYTVTSVPLTIMPGACFNPGLGSHICFPSLAYGEVELSATNTFTDIRAGMRATDEDLDQVPVTITVSE